MAVYANGIETKRLLVRATYRALLAQEAPAIKVRDIAKECNYAPATVYRHFESMSGLISVASICFIDSYIADYSRLLDAQGDFMSIYLNGWELFNRYAFNRPDVYYQLFWKLSQEDFEDAIQEYYGLFPFSGPQHYEAQFYLVFFSGNMQERDFAMLRTAASQGLILADDAVLLSKTNPLIVRGMLDECMTLSIEQRKSSERECNALLRANVERSMRKATVL